MVALGRDRGHRICLWTPKWDFHTQTPHLPPSKNAWICPYGCLHSHRLSRGRAPRLFKARRTATAVGSTHVPEIPAERSLVIDARRSELQGLHVNAVNKRLNHLVSVASELVQQWLQPSHVHLHQTFNMKNHLYADSN